MAERYILKEGYPESLSLFTQYRKGELVDPDFLNRLRQAYSIVLVQYSRMDPFIKIGNRHDYLMTFCLHDGDWYGIRELDSKVCSFPEAAMKLWFVPLNQPSEEPQSTNFVSRVIGLLKFRNFFRIWNQ